MEVCVILSDFSVACPLFVLSSHSSIQQLVFRAGVFALCLHLVIQTVRNRSLCDIVGLLCSLSFFVLSSHSSIQQLVFWAGVFALRLRHGIFGESVSWEKLS